MSNVTRRGPVKPTLNITPLIDVVFLLIVFFMIVNNIVTDELPEIQLPDLDDPVTSQHDSTSRVIVNILADAPYEPGGEARIGPGSPVNEVLERPGDATIVTVGHREWEMDDPEQMEEFREFVAESIAQRMANNANEAPVMMLRVDSAVYYYKVRFVMDYYLMAMLDGGLDPEIEGQTSIHFVAYMPQ